MASMTKIHQRAGSATVWLALSLTAIVGILALGLDGGRMMEERRRARPDLEFVATPHLQTHPLLLEALAERAEEALHGSGHMNCSLCQYRVPILGHEQAVGQPADARLVQSDELLEARRLRLAMFVSAVTRQSGPFADGHAQRRRLQG